MTIFFLLIPCAAALRRDYGSTLSVRRYAAGGIFCTAAVAGYAYFSAGFISENLDTLSHYTKTLGGSESSLKGLLKLAAVGVICVAVIYFCYRRGFVFKRMFLIFLCALTAIESVGYMRIYMTTSAERNERTNRLQRAVFDLEDRISEEGFYRVKTSKKLFDYNMVGALGYNSIAHYTSLTDESYMFAMKRLGYTSVWMEVGSCGGTELTDALLSIGCEISHDSGEAVYEGGGYYINRQSALPLGILAQGGFESAAIPAELTRAEVQQYIFTQIFGEGEAVCEYEPNEGEYSFDEAERKYFCAEGERLIYRPYVEGRQSLYFDCFDRLSNSLTEPIYQSFSVTVNGRKISSSYPSSKENGVLSLGEFEDERVVIEVKALKDCECASFGVFGLDLTLLENACDSVRSVGFSEVKNGLYAETQQADGGTVFLSLPYQQGYKITVNGKEIDYRKAVSGFLAFDISAGRSVIEISFTPPGMLCGAVLSGGGLLLLAVYIFCRKKRIPLPNKLKKPAAAAVVLLGGTAFAAVYVIPILLNIFAWRQS